MRDQPGLRQAGIEIGHWDNVVRRRSREVSTLKTENLTPAKRSPSFWLVLSILVVGTQNH